jgi:hypothetical protein
METTAGLSIEGDYNGVNCSTVISFETLRKAGYGGDFVTSLCDFLKRYRSKSFHEVESVEVRCSLSAKACGSQLLAMRFISRWTTAAASD